MPSADAEAKEQKNVKPEDRLTHLQCYVEKKIRNLDKRRNKLENYKTELASGKTLDVDQANAVEAYDTVVSTLELCREVFSQVKIVIKDNNHQKKIKNDKNAQHDQERLRLAIKFQDILQQLHEEKIRDDFLNGRLGSVKLDEVKLQQLMDLHDLLLMPTGENRSSNHHGIKDQINTCAENFGNLLDGTSQPFQDTTFKNMKMLLNKIASCPYPQQPKPKKEPPPPQEFVQNKQIKNVQNSNSLIITPSHLHHHQTIDFNQGDLMSNGFTPNAPMSYNHMVPQEVTMPVQSSYYNQNHMAPLEISDLMLSSNINFLQESQVSPEPAALYMDPAVVSFGTIQPESVMQMQEQMVQQAPMVNMPVVRHDEQQITYQAEITKESQPQVEPVKSPSPEPIKTSWADESNDRWPNEVNGESNVWNERAESMNWSDDVDERRNYRNKPSTRRNNYGGNGYRGRGGYGGNYNNATRGNLYGGHNYRGRGGNGNTFRPSRGNGSTYTRGTGYRGYRGGYQSQQQRI